MSLFYDAVDQLASLPGVGKRTAMRYALFLLKQPKENVERFACSVLSLKRDVKYCKICNMISDEEVCSICASSKRDKSTICVVESIRDVLSIEATGEYSGVYQVLGGIVSPMDGIGPDDLSILPLIDRVSKDNISEVIIALNTSIEGETTSFYLYKLLSKYPIKITTIARGVGFGDDLEYTDQFTLGKSILNRQIFEPNIK